MGVKTFRDLTLMPLALVGLAFPRVAAKQLGEADFLDSLAHNSQLRESSVERRELVRKEIVDHQPERLRSLRTVHLKSSLGMASAIAVVWLCQFSHFGVQTSPNVLGILSVFCFAWATLGRLGWETFKGTSSIERLDRWIFRTLYWAGMYFGTLSLL